MISEYEKRIQWHVDIIECESKEHNAQKRKADEVEKIKKHLDSNAIIIAMDERGKTYSSREFAQKIDKYQLDGHNKIQFVIGGADGLTDEIRNAANMVISFGKQTWPHLLARIMLLEQIYRSQQILSGHPYHRD